MRLRKFFFTVFILLIMVFNSSCINFNDGFVTQPPNTEIPTITASNIVQISSLITTPTFDRISTPPVSQTASLEVTQASSSTPNIFPTLSEDAAQHQLEDLLASNGGCRLPCLWGITPGVTSASQAQSILAPLSGISIFTAFTPEAASITPEIRENGLIFGNSIDYLLTDNVVTRLQFSGDVVKEIVESGFKNVFDSTVFSKRLSFYMLPHILSDYGRPSTVLLSTLAKPPSLQRGGDTGEFKIILLYPDQGFAVQYTTNMHMQGQYVLGCPANSHVEFQLYSPDNGNSLVDLLPPSWQDAIKNQYKPIEEVASMTTEEFYQTFHEPSDNCIQTLASLWPVPEE